MKTIIKTFGLKSVMLFVLFVCTSGIKMQSATSMTLLLSALNVSESNFSDPHSLQSPFDTISQGGSIPFVVINDTYGSPSSATLYDYTLRDLDGNTIDETYGSSPYFSKTFNVPPGTYIVSAYYQGNPCSGSVSKTVTVTP